VFKLESTVTNALGTHTTVRYGGTRVPHTVANAARLLTLVRERIGAYRNLPQGRYQAVLDWLHQWHQELASESTGT